MRGQTIVIRGDASRFQAHNIVKAAPIGSVVNIAPQTRSIPQNAKMWAMLSDISRAKPEGRNYPPEIWKSLFMASCGHQVRWEPALDGNGVVGVGYRSSRLSKAQMGELIECIQAYAAEQGIELSEQPQ